MSKLTMSDAEYSRRCSEDFKFMVLCQFKGNMAMYHLLRDSELDEERSRRAALIKEAA